MNTKQHDIDVVKALHPNEKCYIFWSEGGGGEVHRIWDTLFLFEIPAYGGDGRYEGAFGLSEIEKLVDEVRTWT